MNSVMLYWQSLYTFVIFVDSLSFLLAIQPITINERICMCVIERQRENKSKYGTVIQVVS